jgi:hypothetical protein
MLDEIPSTEEIMETPEPAPEPIPEPVPGGLEDAPNLTHEDVFNFDPFAAGAVPDAPPAEGDVQDDGTAPAPVAPAAQAPTITPPPAPVAPPPAPTVEQLIEQNRMLAEQNRQILEMIAKPQVAPAAAPTPPKPAEIPDYGFEVPQQIQQMLQSEDPAVQTRGLAALIAGMAKTVHTQVRSEYEAKLTEAVQSARQTFATDTQRAQTAASVFNDFYGKFPQFNRPELRDLVASATKAVVSETQASQWSTGLRDKIGERVSQIISSVSGNPPPSAEQRVVAPAPTATTPRRPNAPPQMRGSSVRPAREAQPEPGTQEAHINEVVFGVK